MKITSIPVLYNVEMTAQEMDSLGRLLYIQANEFINKIEFESKRNICLSVEIKIYLKEILKFLEVLDKDRYNKVITRLTEKDMLDILK